MDELPIESMDIHQLRDALVASNKRELEIMLRFRERLISHAELVISHGELIKTAAGLARSIETIVRMWRAKDRLALIEFLSLMCGENKSPEQNTMFH